MINDNCVRCGRPQPTSGGEVGTWSTQCHDCDEAQTQENWMKEANKDLVMADSQNRADVLVEILGRADADSARELLTKWFNLCDAIGEHSKFLADQFDRVGFVTNLEEGQEIPTFPCTIYRAGWEDSDPETGLSWTTDLEFATKFAKGLFGMRAWFLGIRREGVRAVVWQATCESARAYLTSRGESEVIPGSFKDIEVIQMFEKVKQ